MCFEVLPQRTRGRYLGFAGCDVILLIVPGKNLFGDRPGRGAVPLRAKTNDGSAIATEKPPRQPYLTLSLQLSCQLRLPCHNRPHCLDS
jgi:hypothetical protein